MARSNSRDSSSRGDAQCLDASKGKAKMEACSICLDSITDRAIAVPCNHASFDFLCLVSWAQDHPLCPLCKAPLTAIEYEWASPDDYQVYRIPPPDEQCAGEQATSTSNRGRARVPQRFRNRRKNPRWFAHRSTTEAEAINRRRQVYRNMTFSYHVGANRVSQFREFTPQTFSHSRDLQLKARKWIRRELQVFDFLTPSLDAEPTQPQQRRYAGNTEFLLEYIMSVLKTVDIKDASGKAQGMLAEFLGDDRARLFLHELNAWLRSPYTELEAWDRHVRYANTSVEAPQSGRGQRETSHAQYGASSDRRNR